MTMALPPGGTRGVEIPRLLRPILRAMMGTGRLMFRFGAKVQGRPLIRLLTTGAKTGKQRQVVLGSFPGKAGRADSWVVVASNGGSARHPGWAHNLVARPTDVMVDAGDGEMPVDVELLTGSEREAVWDRVVTLAPGYRSYLTKTDRQMPIFRLTAQDGGG